MSMKAKKPTKWQAILQEAIRNSGMTLSRISERSGVDHGQLSRFMRNERNLTITTAEKVGTLLGLELTKKEER
ncbi:MAG: helix-turn-helix transcriptional regulator [Sedimentisphaerales bacterium]|nr:helix-turn-helix transcriptional regulator [Sedimentisphaerales bacterium]